MAILRGIIRKMRGSVEDFTFRELNGQTTVSAKVTKNTSQTAAQMFRRVKWANLVNLWKAMENYDKPSFEAKPRTWSDYNAFMSANIDGQPVYLEKGEANQGGCVVASYQVSRGSLPSIDVGAGTGGVPVSDIALGALVIDSDTTLKQFSDAVVNNNNGYQHGDQITCFIFLQDQNSVTGVPYVRFKPFEVTLDQLDDETLLSDLVEADGFTSVDGKLGANGTVNGGICWIHSRKGTGRTLVSTQSIYVTNSLLSTYQSSAKRVEAVQSYGGKTTQEYLIPNVDEAIGSI